MKRKYILLTVIFLVVIGWGIRFYYVNATFDGPKLQYFQTGEKVPYENDFFYREDEVIDGYFITVEGATLYPIEDYLALHDIEYATLQRMNPDGYIPDYIYAVDVVFENEGNTDTSMGLNMFATLLISADLRLMINTDIWTLMYPHLQGSLTFKLHTDTTQALQLPYAVETQWEQDQMHTNDLSDRQFVLNITQYPTRKLIAVDRYD